MRGEKGDDNLGSDALLFVRRSKLDKLGMKGVDVEGRLSSLAPATQASCPLLLKPVQFALIEFENSAFSPEGCLTFYQP